LLYSELIEQRSYPAAMPDVFKRLNAATQAANKGSDHFLKGGNDGLRLQKERG
jgi:hypothetical protein